MNLRVAACQILAYPELERSADKIILWLNRAAEAHVEVITFPEGCLFGYTCTPDHWSNADPQAFLAAEQRVLAEAKRLNLAVVLGTAHWEEGQLYNSLLIIDKGGVVRGRYAKTHLVEQWPQPGKRLPIYALAGVPSCFIICHDVRYPELVRLPAIAGAQICYFCSCESGLTVERKLSAYRAMPISRATENGIYVVMCNCPADANNINNGSHGNSKIIHPDGNVLVEAGYFEERLVIADLDMDAAKRTMAKRAIGDETILRDWLMEGVKLVEKT